MTFNMRNTPHGEAIRITRERERERDRRNINPTPEAVLAMNLWGSRYAAQRGGSMDFWGTLSESEQRRCRDLAEDFRKADNAHKAR